MALQMFMTLKIVFVKQELLKIKGVDQKLWKCEFEDYGPFKTDCNFWVFGTPKI